MRKPRDISTEELIRRLKPFGYQPTRQTGSHIRLTTERNGQHHITIPQKRQLTIGKINAVLWEMVRHFRIERKVLIDQIFG
ncbi:MAG: type II toxin-antitoxin system HicA family toxin [Coriobacteriia bacterium]|jgi:predicted RNA binding protein YcfA (HicA-like mRNA interferase family)|nr:type II toxin-antitoxin system HicA family toxin [Coriobacteriia bacterium]